MSRTDPHRYTYTAPAIKLMQAVRTALLAMVHSGTSEKVFAGEECVVISPLAYNPPNFPAATVYAEPVENSDGEASLRIHVEVADLLADERDNYLALWELAHLTARYLDGKAAREELVVNIGLAPFGETGYNIDADEQGRAVQWLRLSATFEYIEE
jgi:hypothetical protein